MAGKKNPLTMMREICLSLPDTTETPTWGQPHFRVANKIFAGCGISKGVETVGFKLEMEHADLLVQNDPEVFRAPYVGHKGWVSIETAKITDWKWIKGLVLESYRLIAPKKSLAKLDGAPAAKKPVRRSSSK